MELQMLSLTFYSSVTIVVVVLAPFLNNIYTFSTFSQASRWSACEVKALPLVLRTLAVVWQLLNTVGCGRAYLEIPHFFKKWWLKKCVGTRGVLRFNLVWGVVFRMVTHSSCKKLKIWECVYPDLVQGVAEVEAGLSVTALDGHTVLLTSLVTPPHQLNSSVSLSAEERLLKSNIPTDVF